MNHVNHKNSAVFVAIKRDPVLRCPDRPIMAPAR